MRVHEWALNIITVSILLFLLTLAGAIYFPNFQNIYSTNFWAVFLLSFISLIISAVILNIIGAIFMKGFRCVKNTLDIIFFVFVGALTCGLTLVVLTFSNFPYCVRLEFNWLGTSWYDPFLTIFFVGAPIILIFVVHPNDVLLEIGSSQ